MSSGVPILDCTLTPSSTLIFHPSSPPLHPLQCPTLFFPSKTSSSPSVLNDRNDDNNSINNSNLEANLNLAASAIQSGHLVAFPTETVYGLGGSSLNPSAIQSIYSLKGRPSDNPLIIHISSLSMLQTLIPRNYHISELYTQLITTFWPGALTLLFPSKNPPPKPAPQTIGIRIPSHPIARALIHLSNTPISAPSANSSGRPSPTSATHVSVDLGSKLPNGENPLRYILSSNGLDIGVESTVVTALNWDLDKGGGVLKVLRPGGVGVEELERVCKDVDRTFGTRTRVWVYGRDQEDGPEIKEESEGGRVGLKGMKDEEKARAGASTKLESGSDSLEPISAKSKVTHLQGTSTSASKKSSISNPSTPGMKYRHYSPSIPVYLLYPTSTFPSSSSLPTSFAKSSSSGSGSGMKAKGMEEVIRLVAAQLDGMDAGPSSRSRQAAGKREEETKEMLTDGSTRSSKRRKFGLMHFESSALDRALSKDVEVDLERLNMGKTSEDAGRALFSGMLALEGKKDDSLSSPLSTTSRDERILNSEEKEGVDAILIEACTTEGVGLAVMERAGKAAGGGGSAGGLIDAGYGEGVQSLEKRFWVDVGSEE